MNLSTVFLCHRMKKKAVIHSMLDFYYSEGKFVGQIKAFILREELFLKLVTYRTVLQQGPRSKNRKLFCAFT